jgi:hypothetical protein
MIKVVTTAYDFFSKSWVLRYSVADRKVKAEDGKDLEQTKFFFGNKSHIRINT